MDDQALVIEHIDISSLSFDPVNARKHNQKNLDAIKGSLAKFGQQKPIVINKNNVVIAGNGTLDAARALGWKKISAVRTTLDQFNQSAYGLADNRTGELADWDMSRLPTILSALDAEGFDLNTIGWDDMQLEGLIIGSAEMPVLSSEEEKTLRQMSFIVHNDQHELIEECLGLVKKTSNDFPGNENSNGNAIYRICLEWHQQKT